MKVTNITELFYREVKRQVFGIVFLEDISGGFDSVSDVHRLVDCLAK